jgi:molybdenum cofactor guanylyltransferase
LRIGRKDFNDNDCRILAWAKSAVFCRSDLILRRNHPAPTGSAKGFTSASKSRKQIPNRNVRREFACVNIYFDQRLWYAPAVVCSTGGDPVAFGRNFPYVVPESGQQPRAAAVQDAWKVAQKMPPPTLGLILAGGLARRMGGGDKARIRVGSATILERVLARLKPHCRALIINANGDPARFADTGLVIIVDSVPDFVGPLAGILAGLDWAAANAPDCPWVASAPGDCPFLPKDLVPRLHEARIAAGAPLACARSGQWSHPVVGLWPVALREDLRHALTGEGLRKIDIWTARHGIGTAEWPDAPFDPFFNVNTPEDAARAEAIAKQYPQA